MQDAEDRSPRSPAVRHPIVRADQHAFGTLGGHTVQPEATAGRASAMCPDSTSRGRTDRKFTR
jgi:hypothetical protein